ncbi:MAG TPA: ribosome maturation factor RimM [Anaerolineaceae bacterium]|nr:ribosome maturation factor RimM [Anaerolineaceae bacterium]
MSKVLKSVDHNADPSGSPHSGEPVYLAVGRLRRAHGIKGEILFEMTTEQHDNIAPGRSFFIGENKIPVTIATIRQNNKLWLIALEGYTSNESVQIFRNQTLYADAAQLLPLPRGRYYHHEVIGMKVEDEQHIELGFVTEILVTGANDVYVVKAPDDSDMLIPAVKAVVLNIDPEKRVITIRPQEWV